MRAPHEILGLQHFNELKPKMIYLGADPWGDECFVPAGWLNKWLDLPEGGADHREGKAWWYDLPEEQVATTYHARNCDGDLHVNVHVHSQPSSMRQVVIPIFRLRHWLEVAKILVNAAPNNCFVPFSWMVEWLRLPEGAQDERLGKSWGFMPPDDNEEMIYRAKIIGGYLIVEVESPSDPSMNRMAVKALAEFHLREDG